MHRCPVAVREQSLYSILLLSAGNRGTAITTTVDIVVLIATHVPDGSVVRRHGTASGVGKRVGQGDGAKVRESGKVVIAKRDGFDDPFSVDFAQRAGRLARVKLVRQRSTSSLVLDVCDTSTCRVGLHLHEDVVSSLYVPVVVEELNRLSRPPLVPGYMASC